MKGKRISSGWRPSAPIASAKPSLEPSDRDPFGAPPNAVTPRFALRAATDDLHRELDGLLAHLDLGDASDYRRFLMFQGRTVPAVERALESAGVAEWIEGWRPRSPAIEADLKAMNAPMPASVAPPVLHGAGQILGMAYVLEGSRLGARVLRTQVGNGFPVSFLGEDVSHVPWPTFVALLDRLIYSDELLGEAKDAARRCFALFLNVAHEAGT